MRFGKKLALHVAKDQLSAPYISHHLLKDVANRIVREVRLYQARSQAPQEVDVQQELSEIGDRIGSLDSELFSLLDDDLGRIREHIRSSEAHLEDSIAELQSSCLRLGLIVDEPQLKRLESAVPVAVENKAFLCQQLLDLRMRSEPTEVARQLMEICMQYNSLVEVTNLHMQYLEINVAGFRKLLKRHEKQIPRNFHSRPTPFLGFHCLITRASCAAVETTRQLGNVIADAQRRLGEVSQAVKLDLHPRLELRELSNLGAECQMVLEIQKELKQRKRSDPFRLCGSTPCNDSSLLYLKPGASGTGPHSAPLGVEQQAVLQRHTQPPYRELPSGSGENGPCRVAGAWSSPSVIGMPIVAVVEADTASRTTAPQAYSQQFPAAPADLQMAMAAQAHARLMAAAPALRNVPLQGTQVTTAPEDMFRAYWQAAATGGPDVMAAFALQRNFMQPWSAPASGPACPPGTWRRPDEGGPQYQ